jgi:cell division protein FtsL
MFLAGVLPLSYLLLVLLTALVVAMTLRAYAIHEYARQMAEVSRARVASKQIDRRTDIHRLHVGEQTDADGSLCAGRAECTHTPICCPAVARGVRRRAGRTLRV